MRQFIDLVDTHLVENAGEPGEAHRRFWYNPATDEFFEFEDGHHFYFALNQPRLNAIIEHAMTPEEYATLRTTAERVYRQWRQDGINGRSVMDLHYRILDILGDAGMMRGGFDGMTNELYIEYKGSDAAKGYRQARKLMRHFPQVDLLTVETWPEGMTSSEHVLIQDAEMMERFRKFGSTRARMGVNEDIEDDTGEKSLDVDRVIAAIQRMRS